MNETESPLYEQEKKEDSTKSCRGNIFSSLLAKNYENQPDNCGPCTYVEVMYGDNLQNPPIVDQTVKKSNSVSHLKLANDEGYNSHSSGESAPLLKAPVISKQDEAGYEVPHITVNAEQNLPSSKNKKKSSISKFWQRYSYDFKETNKNDDQKIYYEPPDSLHNYFLAQSRYPAIPFVVWLILSLAIASSLSLLLYLIARLDLILSIVLSSIVFLLVLVMFVTLSIRHALCIAVLLVPSMFSSRAKLSVVIFILLLLVMGPILGINDKLNVARTCRNDDRDSYLNKNEIIKLSESSDIYEQCTKSFLHVHQFCHKMVNYFKKSCVRKSLPFETKICNQTDEFYCGSNLTALQKCSMKTEITYKPVLFKFHSTIIISQIVMYFMPFLSLLFISEAYRYNKDYLTKKDEDNIYITPVLQSLDRERKNRGLCDFVVPLTRIEFQTYLIRKSFSLSRCECLAICKWFFIALSCGLLVLVVVLLDDWINSALGNVLKLQCKYNFDHYANKKYRNVIYAMLCFLVLLIMFQSYVLRLRSVICDYFYFDVVNIRSKHLYYKILHDRHSFTRHVRRKVELMSEQKRLASKISFASKVFELLPQQVQNACLKLAIRTCMVCDSLTYYKTVECKQQFCKAHYCFECFVDAGQCCLRCQNSENSNKIREITSVPVRKSTSVPVSVSV
nr:uncharacterized protein LOC105843665 isoform X2 [Hydra vulgaris]